MCGLMTTALLRALSAALEISQITASGAFWSTAITILKSGATEKIVIVR